MEMKIKLKMAAVQEVGSGKVTEIRLEIKNPTGIGYLLVLIPPKRLAALMLGHDTIDCKAQQWNGGLKLET